LKIIGNKSVSKRKFASKVKIPAIFIASILLIGALIPTTLSLFPGQLLNQVLADPITGTDGDDNLEGSDNDDDIEGKGGDDAIKSGKGNDINFGDNRFDSGLSAGGNDKINAAQGDDKLTGGGGADKFKCGSGDDTVTDFNEEEGDKASGNCEIT
jgi:Ca2+-binding RTX toxin-like protein